MRRANMSAQERVTYKSNLFGFDYMLPLILDEYSSCVKGGELYDVSLGVNGI